MTPPPGDDAHLAGTDPRGTLRVLRARNDKQVAALSAQLAGIVAASAESNADDEHDPEGATIAWERQQVIALLAQARRKGEALGRAVGRVAAGTYGACDVCGRPIAPARLQARPDASTCIDCAH